MRPGLRTASARPRQLAVRRAAGDHLAAGENPYDILFNIASAPDGAVFETGIRLLSGLTLETTDG